MMIEALYGCQFAECAEEVSYPAHMLKMLNGAPVCEDCVDDMGKVDWLDLEKFVPPEQAKIADLQAKLGKAVEALQEASSYLSALNSIQPSPSTKAVIADLNKALAKSEGDE